jgi:hypothetical protein
MNNEFAQSWYDEEEYLGVMYPELTNYEPIDPMEGLILGD